MVNKYILDIIIIFTAVAMWDIIRDTWHWFRHRNEEIVKCDLCHKPRMTYKTRDHKFWACKRCRVVYNKTQV